MPSEVRGSSTEEFCVLMAGVSEGQALAEVEHQLRLLRCLEGVRIAEMCCGNVFPTGEMQTFVAPHVSRFGGYQFVVAVLLLRPVLVDVLSCMLQMGYQEFVKTQHLGR